MSLRTPPWTTRHDDPSFTSPLHRRRKSEAVPLALGRIAILKPLYLPEPYRIQIIGADDEEVPRFAPTRFHGSFTGATGCTHKGPWGYTTRMSPSGKACRSSQYRDHSPSRERQWARL